MVLLFSFLATPVTAQPVKGPTPITFDCTTITDVPVIECEALVSLFINTGGATWSNKTNWLTSTVADDWYGVTVASGHVTILNLNSNNLVGTLPAQLGNLSGLAELYLFYNQLSGSIPASLGNLTALNTLVLFSNQLTGAIPPELGNLTNLTTLSLYSNELSGSIPTVLGSLTKLTNLDLHSNLLSGSIPTTLGSLVKLRDLSLSSNQLTGPIPVELANLTDLNYLDMSGNLLSGSIPPQLGTLSNLYNLHLYSNQLTGTIPSELSNLSSLQYLNLGGNLLSGSIPPELGNLISLTQLHLFDSGLTGSIPPELGNLSQLMHLSLYDNSLSGSIPSTIGNLDELQTLYLWENDLTGSIPPELGNMNKIQWIYLDHNLLSGAIPIELGNLVTLKGLTLAVNGFSGSVPTTFINLINMDYFVFSDTSLCEPASSAYQAWKATVVSYYGTGISCSVVSPVDEEKLSSSKVTFVWDPVPDAIKYKIQLSTREDFSTTVFSVNTTTNTYPYLTSLLSGKTYYWRIRALAGVSWTDWESHRFYSMDPLAAPGLAAPENGSLRYPNLSLTWFSVTNAVQYQLQVARDSAFTDLVFKGKVSDTFKDFSDLAPGKYYWRVKSIEAGGLKSPWSQVRQFTVVKVFPPALVSPGKDSTVNPDVTLTWEAAEFATQYKLQVSKDAAFTKLIVDEKTTALSKALTGLAARNYYWRVRAFTADGFKSPWSEVRKFTVVTPP